MLFHFDVSSFLKSTIDYRNLRDYSIATILNPNSSTSDLRYDNTYSKTALGV